MPTRVTLSGEEIGVFDETKMSMSLAMQLEDATGFSVYELLQQVARLSARGLQALVWITQVQNGNPAADRHPEFAFEDLKLVDLDTDEQAKAGKESAPVKAVKAA